MTTGLRHVGRTFANPGSTDVRPLIARVTALAAVAMSLSCAAQAQERDLKFVLDFISLGRHAPWYVALGKGYFKDEGLNVTIMPSKGTADAIRTVATGGAEIGFIDIPSLVASGSAGAAVKIVAANYQKPPYCIFTLNPGANVTEPKQMAGLELGSSTASFVPKIWAAFMEMNKVDSKTLKIVNIDAASRVPMLAAGKVQSIDQFLMSEPAIRRAVTTAKPVCLFAGDYGLEIYANSIGVSGRLPDQEPGGGEEVRARRAQGLEGRARRSRGRPPGSRSIVKALDPQIVVEEIQILKRIAITPDVEKNGFGYVSMDRMKNTVDFINKNIEVSGDKLTAEQIFPRAICRPSRSSRRRPLSCPGRDEARPLGRADGAGRRSRAERNIEALIASPESQHSRACGISGQQAHRVARSAGARGVAAARWRSPCDVVTVPGPARCRSRR